MSWIQAHTAMAVLIGIAIVVIPFLVYYVVTATKNHPKGLIAAALSNMGERFGYYIMNAVLLLFICSKFGIADATAGFIYAVFYCCIYLFSLPGGIVADRLQNYKGTIMCGLLIMALGYVLLSLPVFGGAPGHVPSWVLVFTCVALFLIAAGNGLFKGNLQAIVGQMYDNFEAEAAAKGPEALALAKSKRDSGFQIFYVFINIGGVIAPFVAPLLREWLLGTKNLIYNSQMPAFCHQYLSGNMDATAMNNLTELAAKVNLDPTIDAAAMAADPAAMSAFCENYLQVFNTGVHFSFIASVAAMLISFVIFACVKKNFPNPVRKEKSAVVDYTPEERIAQAKEIKQRMAALFAVLGVAIFFWFSFHQNGQSLSIFARDFVSTDAIAPEIWQCINPFFVIVLTPIIILIFGALARKGKDVSTPKKIAIGMFIVACAYIFLSALAKVMGYPSGNEWAETPIDQRALVGPWVLILTYFFLTVAELFISPLGLSFVSKIAPRHLQGICQGLWLCATAVANLFIFLGVTMLNNIGQQWITWAVFALICLASMGVMLGMLKWLERITK